MSVGLSQQAQAADKIELQTLPPFIWPEARYSSGVGRYQYEPPTRSLYQSATLISGVIVGAAEATLQWLEDLCSDNKERKIVLILVLYPAGPTRSIHLNKLRELCDRQSDRPTKIEVRVLPMENLISAKTVISTYPPTVIQAHDGKTGQTVLTIGSNGDAGFGPIRDGSLNLVFRPDDGLRNAWRLWFQYTLGISAPLTVQAQEIPHLVPAEGDALAKELWDKFKANCAIKAEGVGEKPKVNKDTGEVIQSPKDKEKGPWDGGQTALSEVAQALQAVYAGGWLVTVDETTRIKPFTIPVKATLLGQQSERVVGTVKQRQSFSLQVLDDKVEKELEKYRKVTDLMEMLSYPLSQGNRWLSDAAKQLLDKELEARNGHAKQALEKALGGKTVEVFVQARTQEIRGDLNDMYGQLGQGREVPEYKVEAVLEEVKTRLQAALDNRITPRAVYNKIGAPDLTAQAPDDNWAQPLAMLSRSASLFRDKLFEPFFARQFKTLSFTEDEYRKAMDVFGDWAADRFRGSEFRSDLMEIDNISESKTTKKEKSKEIWRLIKEAPPRKAKPPEVASKEHIAPRT